METSKNLDPDLLAFVVDHVVLPPILPQTEEEDSRFKNSEMLRYLAKMAEKFQESLGVDISRKVKGVLTTMCNLHDPQANFEKDFQHAVRGLNDDDSFGLYIRSQNAGIIFRRADDALQFETFEASPIREAVLECQGRLECLYPGPVTSVPWTEATDPAFLQQLAAFLRHMDTECFDNETLLKTQRRGNELPEPHEVPDPKFITNLLTGILRGIGGPASVDRIKKHIRDEVHINPSGQPWRRSALWLVVRVTLQRTLETNDYKLLILEIHRRIVEDAVKLDLSTSLVSSCNKKMARRANKLGERGLSLDYKKYILSTAEAARKLISDRWDRTKADSNRFIQRNHHCRDKSNKAANTKLAMTTSGRWIESRLEHYKNPVATSKHILDPREKHRNRSSPKFAPILYGTEFEIANQLIDFENWVNSANLSSWCSDCSNSGEILKVLAESIRTYHPTALKTYGEKNLFDKSRMLLTIIRIWIELDRITCDRVPLLRQYEPEVPLNILEKALFIEGEDMALVEEAENYIQKRSTSCSGNKMTNIFTLKPSRDSFAVRYYEKSSQLKQLRNKISREAEEKQSSKKKELHDKNREYEELVSKYKKLEHEDFVTWRGFTVHDRNCERCRLERIASKMSICLFESPLPSNEVEAKSVVFELQPPEDFAIWRDITYYILSSVCSIENPQSLPENRYAFDRWEILNSYQSKQSHRITWYSSSSPIGLLAGSHLKNCKIPAAETDVIRTHVGNYQLYDIERSEWIEYQRGSCDTSKLFQLELKGTPYEVLAYALNGTEYPHNKILATQHLCPKSLSIHEYEAFASVRCGGLLQWHNMLIELRKDDLSFKENVIYQLFCQSACQVGKRSDPPSLYRQYHLTLSEESFSQALLSALRDSLSVLEKNWEQVNKLRILVLLARRAATCGHEAIQSGILEFFRTARKICHKWIQSIREKLHNAHEDKTITQFRHYVLMVSGIFCSTFDAGEGLEHQVFWDTQDIIDFLVCQNLIYDNCLGVLSNLPQHVASILEECRRFSIRIESWINEVIRLHNSEDQILAKTVETIAPTLAVLGEWEQLPTPAERWWKIISRIPENGTSTTVHFDVLQGRLLIDGEPNGRLPEAYFTHKSYKRLLGGRIFDVVPSQTQGMTYKTQQKFHEVTLEFHLESDNLVIRKIGESSYEYIPRGKFRGDLPRPLFEQGTQWLDLNTGDTRFNKLKDWWTMDPAKTDWVLKKRNHEHWEMANGSSKLLEMQGNIHVSVAGVLGPIEDSEYIVTTTTDATEEVKIELPRYKISFSISRDGLYECETLRGWVIDDEQGFGTLVGLKSFIKLRETNSISNKECILVPFGAINSRFQASNQHTIVEIKPLSEIRSYTIFTIDKVLNRLLDDGTLAARYTRLYLHAITSGVLPDDLTGHTGDAEACSGLQSARSFSFQDLSQSEIAILNKIANLSPQRVFYPENLAYMQQIEWRDDLAPWVQNEGFYFLVQDIFTHWEGCKFAAGTETTSKVISKGDLHLLGRARYFGSIFRNGDPNCLQRKEASKVHDLRHDVTADEARVYSVASALHKWESHLDLSLEVPSQILSLTEIKGASADTPSIYDKRWARKSPVKTWCRIYSYCRTLNKDDRFGLLFVFSSMVYMNPKVQQILNSLTAIAASGKFRNLRVPDFKKFELYEGTRPETRRVQDYLDSHRLLYEESPYSKSDRLPGESQADFNKRRAQAYTNALENELDQATADIIGQWNGSSQTVRRPASDNSYELLRFGGSLPSIEKYFATCFRNLKLKEHLEQVNGILKTLKVSQAEISSFNPRYLAFEEKPDRKPRRLQSHASVFKLMQSRMTGRLAQNRTLHHYKQEGSISTESRKPDIMKIESLADRLSKSGESFVERYSGDLRESCAALDNTNEGISIANSSVISGELTIYEEETFKYTASMLSNLIKRLSPSSELERIQAVAGLWPEITKRALIQQLELSCRDGLSEQWRRALVGLAEATTWEQRAIRLRRLFHDSHFSDFQKEAKNLGRNRWQPEKLVDWLLFEVESGFLIRPTQADVGSSMMRGNDGGNAVMQLNMGEGKSAVITPTIAAALADGSRLVRVVVLKPLSSQMFQILADRLGGLCNRRIYYLPFHRGLPLTTEVIRKMRNIYQECKDKGGILLTLPEHILSFKLIGIEKKIKGEESMAQELIDTREWLTLHARDILDESDEILDIRYQLIYTMGSQHTIEGGEERWRIIQEVLCLVEKCAIKAATDHRASIEVSPPDLEKYRQIRFIDRNFGDNLLKNLASEICNGNTLKSISTKLKLIGEDLRLLACKFIAEKDISIEEQTKLLESCPHLKIQLLVLRGLIAEGVLSFIFQNKRYRVDYGLDKKRSQLAVPYRAKDRPAVKAEFGHPEVVLTLTCLTYYYEGLSNENLQSCFNSLLKTSNPAEIYDTWTEYAKCFGPVPSNISKIEGLNLLDEERTDKEIFPFFKFNKAVIDYFLAELVFPLEAKGFPLKLSTSGWDLAELKETGNNTTGFSGTNDNKYLLPTSIEQLDVKEQRHTNSLVFMNILRKENQVLEIQKNGNRLGAKNILETIASNSEDIKVLLDVGAQILELSNKDVAKTWLDLCPADIIGAVYFGENDELSVLRRDGKVESFMASPISTQLERAIVYLDEAHTRGTDIKLPHETRAAVTLGPNLNKDKFVQGCMRMRKLGNGHSLTLLIQPDIYMAIKRCSGKFGPDRNSAVDVSDVVLWTMIESCRQIQHGFGIWANQGFQYLKRSCVWETFKQSSDPDYLKSNIQEQESHSLIEMYGVKVEPSVASDAVPASKAKDEILDRLETYQAKQIRGTAVQEEQERELDHELEEEPNKEMPNPASPSDHKLHPVLKKLVSTGKFIADNTAFDSAFNVFLHTSAKDLFRISDWGTELYATQDFMKTINSGKSSELDDYLRPVRWIMTLEDRSRLIILSPFEANALVPIFRASTKSTLHCYAPKVSKNMLCFDKLDFCPIESMGSSPIPYQPEMRTQLLLNIFAGQLFFDNFECYEQLCQFLGIYFGKADSTLERDLDGWVNLESRKRHGLVPFDGISWPYFDASPMRFIFELTKMRRKGQGFSLTHLGSILNSSGLEKMDFDTSGRDLDAEGEESTAI